MTGEGDQRPGQLVYALTTPAAGERLDPVEIMAFRQGHRVGCMHPRNARSRGLLTMTGAGKLGIRLLPESAKPHA